MANANIFAQYVKPVRSMAEYGADYDSAEGNKLALAAKRMQMQQAERGMAYDQAVRGIVQQHGSDKNALVRALYGGGYASQAQGIEKSIADQLKAKGDADKTAVETDAARFKLAKDRRDAYEQARGGLERDKNLSKDKVLAVLNELGTYGHLPGELVQKLSANLPDDPEQLRQDIRNGNLSRLTPEQMVTLFAPKTEYKDNGQSLIPVQMNPNAPGYAPAPIQRLQTPDSIANNATSIENNKRTVGASYANAAATRGAAQETASATRDAARIQTGFKNEQSIREEFNALPEVKRYKAATPSYKAIETAAKENNPQADINLIYGLAKLYDPESVVREGEYGTIANSQSIPEWIKGQAQRLAGGGRLTTETKAQIIRQAKGRIDTYKNEQEKARKTYGEIAKKRGMDLDSVLPAMGDAPAGGGGGPVDFGRLP